MRLLIYIVVFITIGCDKYSADPLTLSKKDFVPSVKNLFLKTDGYFIEIDSAKGSSIVFFIYKNGLFVDFGGVDKGSSEEIERAISIIDSLQNYKKRKYGWGLFEAETEDIIIEKWLSGNGGPYPVEQFKGKILNDTTISIPFSYWPLDGSEKSRTFRFQKFSPKPDSTNMFIK